MRHAIAFTAAFVVLFVSMGASKNPTDGTSGAGESREWIGAGPNTGITKSGIFLGVKNGIVSVQVTENVAVRVPVYKTAKGHSIRVPGKNITLGRTPDQQYIHHYTTKTESRTTTYKSPLKNLAFASRQWVEQKNPTACSLTKASQKRTIGTLAADDGEYILEKKLGNDKAVFLFDGKKGQYRFILDAPVVASMAVGAKCETIGTRNQYDFVVCGKEQCGENSYTLIEKAN
jgi:hypothetical protein